MNKIARDSGYFLDCVLTSDPLEIYLKIGDGYIDEEEDSEFLLREENQLLKLYSISAEKEKKVVKIQDLSTFIRRKNIVDMHQYFQVLQKDFVDAICKNYKIDKAHVYMKEV